MTNQKTKECCEKCKNRNCDDEIKRTTEIEIWSCPCHRGLSLCPKCKEFACFCHATQESEAEDLDKLEAKIL